MRDMLSYKSHCTHKRPKLWPHFRIYSYIIPTTKKGFHLIAHLRYSQVIQWMGKGYGGIQASWRTDSEPDSPIPR